MLVFIFNGQCSRERSPEVVVERGVPCMLAFMFNSICSKHLDRKLQTSMFLMSSSRHVKGGCQWFNPFT